MNNWPQRSAGEGDVRPSSGRVPPPPPLISNNKRYEAPDSKKQGGYSQFSEANKKGNIFTDMRKTFDEEDSSMSFKNMPLESRNFSNFEKGISGFRDSPEEQKSKPHMSWYDQREQLPISSKSQLDSQAFRNQSLSRPPLGGPLSNSQDLKGRITDNDSSEFGLNERNRSFLHDASKINEREEFSRLRAESARGKLSG